MKDNQERMMMGWATMRVHFVGDKCSQHCEFLHKVDIDFMCFKYDEPLCGIWNETAPRCKQCIEDFGGVE